MDLFQLKGVNLHEFGLGDGTEEESEINFYPNLTGNSTRHPETKALVRKFAEENYPPEMVENFFSFEKVKIKLRRLSDVLKDLGEPPIDLLKIDVEGDELPVLMGIDPEHWTLIRQLVLEVHNAADNLENVFSYINKADSGLILTAGEIDSLDTALIWGQR
jgi:FkbM family methyltransferase